MEAAAQGAHEAGGLVVGILPDAEHRAANQYVDIVIPTGIGLARNSITALACDVMVALPGHFGTLQEMSYALEYSRPVLAWRSGWDGLPGLEVVRLPAGNHTPAQEHELGRAAVEQWLAGQAYLFGGS